MLFLTSHSYREIEPFELVIRAYKQFPKFKDYEFKLQKPFVQDGLVQTYQTRGPFRAHRLGRLFSSSETLNMTHVKTWLWTTFGCGATSVTNSTGILVLEVWRRWKQDPRTFVVKLESTWPDCHMMHSWGGASCA